MTDRSERLNLEPGSVVTTLPSAFNNRPHPDEVAHSIAISLKRIADAFERAEKHATGDRP